MNFNDVENDQKAIDLVQEVFVPWVALGNTVSSNQIKALKASINRCHEKGIAKANDSLLNKLVGTSRIAEHGPAPEALIRTVADVIILGHIWMHRVGRKPFDVSMARQSIETRIESLLDDALARRNKVRGLGGGDGCDDCECDSGGCGGCAGGGCGHP
ncbi:MAG: hypothetical protein U9Q03_06355 [Patescibacteria group bacterium]|nr:hypothetical protein [Patescibacteria group bacterium]